MLFSLSQSLISETDLVQNAPNVWPGEKDFNLWDRQSQGGGFPPGLRLD